MRKCAAKGCEEQIKEDRFFCVMHWTFLDDNIQDELMEHYVPGQCSNSALTNKKFRVALEAARRSLWEEERRYD